MSQVGFIRRARWALMLISAIVALVVLWPATVSSDPLARARPAVAYPEIPGLGASAALAIDLNTGMELYALNPDTQLPPASTMKIVTALVAKSILPLDHQVTVQPGDIPDPLVYTNMGLEPGDVVSVETLLYGLLLPSGGDAALVLAREAGQRLDPQLPAPVDRFVAAMNDYALRIGMTSSHFTNPTGTDDPNNYSTARDLARATRVLLNDWTLANIVRMQSVVVEVGGPKPRAIELFSTNQLLSQGDVFGVKTGTEETAGQCLVAGFWRGDSQIIAVVLGSADRYADTWSLMSHVDATYRWVALGIGTRSAGATEDLAAQGLTFKIRRTVLMTVEQAEQLTYAFVPSTAPDGRQGVVEFLIDSRVITRLPVYPVDPAAATSTPTTP